MPTYLEPLQVEAFVSGRSPVNPDLLGPHLQADGSLLVRAFDPRAERVELQLASQRIVMRSLPHQGWFEAILPEQQAAWNYSLAYYAAQSDQPYREHADPYAFPSLLDPEDCKRFDQDLHVQAYRFLGAHLREFEGQRGVHFVVWAPHAAAVHLVGDFNQWDTRTHPMRATTAGLWELFLPGIELGQRYQYAVLPADSKSWLLKADPYAFYADLRPDTASRVYALEGYEWGDAEWLAKRAEFNARQAPISIYEVHLGSWRRVPEEGNRWLSYRELADQLVPYLLDMGYTHVALMPITEYPLDESWGYQALGYFAPTSRYGLPHDFMYFVDRCHQHGIGVLIDWIPSTFPTDAYGLACFDGSKLYEDSVPFSELDQWGTVRFDYTRNQVCSFLLSNIHFWLQVYHIDGVRIDSVAAMLKTNSLHVSGKRLVHQAKRADHSAVITLLREISRLMSRSFPGTITIVEGDTCPQITHPFAEHGLNMTFATNVGWVHDMLVYFSHPVAKRPYHHGIMTFSLVYAFNEQFILPLSHEAVTPLQQSLLQRMPGPAWEQFANLRLLIGFMYAHPGKKLLFMGGEFAQISPWQPQSSLDWHLLERPEHAAFQYYVRDLNRIYREQPALYEVDADWRGFSWIDFQDSEHSIIAFMRLPKAQLEPSDEADRPTGPSVQAASLLIVCNFANSAHHDYRIGVPLDAYYREILNSDSHHYGGTNLGNQGGLASERQPYQGQPNSLRITIPPLAMLIFAIQPKQSEDE
jgi:alpha-1,4-glucan:alpha-1,4-glucan 6-glycosyltransferase